MKTNALIYKATKEINNKTRIEVCARLDDECKNKIADFSATCSIYEKKPRGRVWDCVAGGCNHEEIIKYFPELAPICRLHLSDVYGAPMYAAENGAYIFKTKGRAAGAEYLRIDPNSKDAETLEAAAKLDDKKYFAFVLENSGIAETWAKEAAAGRALLERLTGCEFENPYTSAEERPNFKALSAEDRAEISEKIAAGFYTPDALAHRQAKEAEEKRIRARAEIERKYDDTIQKAKFERALMLLVFDTLGTAENVIYYDHSRTLAFNWAVKYSSFTEKTWTDQEIKKFDRARKDAGFDIVVTNEATKKVF